MKAEIIKHTVISAKNAGKLNYNAWPSIVSVNGELLCAWSGGRHAHICPFGKVNAAKSTDGGRTWQPSYTVLDTPLDDRDAGLCAANGSIILTSFNNSRRMQRYYADEYGYKPEVRAFYEGYLNLVTDDDEKRYLGSLTAVSTDGGKTFSEPNVLPITSPHGPCATADGKLLYIGRAFSDNAEASFSYLKEGIYAVKLDARGRMLGRPAQVVPPAEEKSTLYCEPHAAALPDGRIILGIRVQNYEKDIFTIYQCYSDDGGKTFSRPQPTGFDGSPPHYLVHSSGALILTYARRRKPFAQIARVSRDNGKTWSEEIILRDDAPDWDLGYPCTAENADGELATVYYQKLGTIGNDICCTVWRLK